MNQYLRAFVAPPVDLDLIPSSQPSVTPDSGEPIPFVLSTVTVISQDESLFQYFTNLFFLFFVNFLLMSCFIFELLYLLLNIFFIIL